MELISFLTHCRRKFFAALKKLQIRASSSHQISDFQELSRFIFSRDHYSRGRVKQGAFLPQKGKTAISMFFVDQLNTDEIWSLGDFAGKNRRKRAIARADTSRQSVASLKVKLDLIPEGHPRHFNLSGWPIDKDEQKALALEFCAISSLFLRH